jgi:ABC-type transporter Mla maintaining outer membrane lipid asymmetry ATPase subunit MlaF
VSSARIIGDNLIILNKGHIAVQGTADELDRSQDEIVRQFMISATEGDHGILR